MNKEEILRISRQENKYGDEREKDLRLSAARLSRFWGIWVCLIIALLELVFLETRGVFWACMTVIYAMYSANEWIVYFSLKKFSVWAIVHTSVFILSVVSFLIEVF